MVKSGSVALGWLWLSGALLSGACGHTARDAPSELAPGGAPAEQPSGGVAGSASAGRPATGGAAPVSFGGAATSGGSTSIELPGAGMPGLEPEIEPHGPVPCEDPQPLPLGGGFELCKNGTLHRTEAVACVSALPRAEPASGVVYDECERDQDCVEEANGFCMIGACYYGCTKDEECGAGALCFCGDFIGSCQRAECRTDADCSNEYPCTGISAGPDASDFHCQTPLDACQTHEDCASFGPRLHCLNPDATRRRCVPAAG